MKTTVGLVLIVACAALLYGCAATVPKELVDARMAYETASAGPALNLAPDDLHKAKVALDQAEKSFADDAESFLTADLAYVAQRKAQMAGVQGSIAMQRQDKVQADADFQAKQGEILAEKTQDLQQQSQDLAQTRSALGVSERNSEQIATQLAAEQKAVLEAQANTAMAQAKTADAQAKLAALAAKEDERGLVISLSGSILFRSNEDMLMHGAEARLDQVAEALVASNDRNVVVEGYTDSNGTDAYNLDLSQRRADSVRDYLVFRGYPAELMLAKGMGETRPIADNATAEGRANNRRVEIVLKNLVALKN
jgi:outer membrane protein OmpA-like peptidoglycan-associated protein